MIKSSFKLILAALAATAALTACTKEPTPGKADADPKAPVTEGSRVIAVSFAPQSQTKTYLDADGLTPYFKKDDKILLCVEPKEPDTEPKVDTCKVQTDGNGKTFITTDLKGNLHAYYPVTAVKKEVSEKSGKEKIGVFVPSVQSGKFEDANILTSEIGEDSDDATFEPYTALLRFYVDKSIGVKSIKVTGTEMRINDDEDSNHITTVTAPEGHTLDEVTDDPGGRLCYVAVPDDINITGVKFEIETTTQGKVEKTTKATGKFVKGEMYDVFIPYYIEVNVGTDLAPIYQKWAYCNIGAFLPEEPGFYFAWGDTKGYKWDAENEQFEVGHSFSWANCPFTNGEYSEENKKVFTKYVPADKATEYGYSDYSDNKNVLDLCDDAANVNWGGKWRMPTGAESSKLINKVSGNAPAAQNGVYCIPGTQLIIPANSGHGEGTSLSINDYYQHTYIWTSSVYLENYPMSGFCMNFSNKSVSYTSNYRYRGLSVRPIYDPDLKDDTKGTINGHEYVVIAGKKWATQNLAVSASGQMKWKGKNSTAVKTPVTNEDVVVGDYFQWAASYDGYGITDNPQPDSLLVYESFTNMYCVDGGATDYNTSVFTFRTGKGFSKDCAPYVDGNSYSKYISSGDQLELTDDTANILWGETWRMPTVEDINSLYAATYWAYDSEDKGFYVFSPDANHMGGNYSTDLSGLNKADALLFFPNAGVGEPGYSTVYDLGSRARYWYNSTYSYYTNYLANIMHIYSASTLQIADAHKDRFNGCSIRPVSD